MVGAVPALLAVVIRLWLKEPEQWQRASHEGAVSKQLGSYRELFRHPVWRRHALIGLALACSGVIGLWAVGFFTTDLITLVMRNKMTATVLGEQVISDRFTPGRAAPLSIVAEASAAEAVTDALNTGLRTPIQEMYPMAASVPSDEPELRLMEAYLNLEPFSDEATDTIPGLRRAAQAAAPGTRVLIGGEVAEAYDTREALGRDTLEERSGSDGLCHQEAPQADVEEEAPQAPPQDPRAASQARQVTGSAGPSRVGRPSGPRGSTHVLRG